MKIQWLSNDSIPFEYVMKHQLILTHVNWNTSIFIGEFEILEGVDKLISCVKSGIIMEAEGFEIFQAICMIYDIDREQTGFAPLFNRSTKSPEKSAYMS